MAEAASDKQVDKAVELLAEGRLTELQIAEDIGVHRTTLYRWRQDPQFAARVDELVKRARDEAERRGIAVKAKRIAAYTDRWQRLQRVIEARADDPFIAQVPGGSTGLVIAREKVIGSGDNAKTTIEHEVDTGTLKALLDLERQAAQELGQWVEQQAVQQTLKAYSIEASPETLWPPQPNASTSPEAPPSISGAT